MTAPSALDLLIFASDYFAQYSNLKDTLWCSAAPPGSDPLMTQGGIDFVCGTSNSIALVGPENGDVRTTDLGNFYRVDRGLRSDVLAVEWLSPTIFVAGQRNGTITVYELNYSKSSKPQVRLLGAWRHPSSIVRISRVDEWKILVTGLADQVFSTTPLPSTIKSSY